MIFLRREYDHSQNLKKRNTGKKTENSDAFFEVEDDSVLSPSFFNHTLGKRNLVLIIQHNHTLDKVVLNQSQFPSEIKNEEH